MQLKILQHRCSFTAASMLQYFQLQDWPIACQHSCRWWINVDYFTVSVVQPKMALLCSWITKKKKRKEKNIRWLSVWKKNISGNEIVPYCVYLYQDINFICHGNYILYHLLCHCVRCAIISDRHIHSLRALTAPCTTLSADKQPASSIVRGDCETV